MDESIRIPIIIEGDQAFIKLSDLGNAAKGTAAKIKGLTDPMKASSNAVFAFNQILREAPAFAFNFQTGIIAISNNLPIFTDALKRAREAGNSNMEVMKGLGKSLFSLPSILSFASLAFITLGDKIFGSNKLFSDGEIALEKYKQAIDSAKDSVDSFKSSLDFEGRLAKLTAELRGVSGTDLQIFGTETQLSNNVKLIDKLNTEINKLTQRDVVFKRIAENIKAGNAAAEEFGTQIALGKLLSGFSDVTKIPESMIGKLNSKDQQNLRLYIENTKQLNDLTEQRTNTINENAALSIQLGIQHNSLQKELLDKSKSDYDKYVNDIIAKAHKFYSFYKDSITTAPDFSIFDTKQDEFRKSLDYVNQILSGDFAFKVKKALSIPFTIDLARDKEMKTVFLGGDIKTFKEQVEENINKGIQQLVVSPRFHFSKEVLANQENQKELADAARELMQGLNETMKNLAVDVFATLAEGLGNVLGGGTIKDAFRQLGNAIGQGLQALGRQMVAAAPIIKLLKDAIKTLNPSILLPAGIALIGIGAALRTALSNGVKGFAKGGLSFGPVLGMFGEGIGTTRQNPEVTAPLDSLRSFFGDIISGRSFGRGGNVGSDNAYAPVEAVPVRLEMEGDMLIGYTALMNLKQRRNR